MLRTLLYAGGAVVLGLWAWGVRDVQSLHGKGGAITSIGRAAGFLAAYLSLVLVLLIARIPWFERAVGFDRLAAWHRALGTNTVVLMAAHVALILWGYSATDHRPVTSEIDSVVTTYPAMIRATVAFGLFIAVAATSGRLLRRYLSYELWWLVHLSTYVAILLVFGHQVENGDDLLAHPAAQEVWRGLYVVVFACVVWWRAITPLSRSYAHRTRVAGVAREGADTVSISIAGDRLSLRHAKPGQFVIVRFLRRGLWSTGHPYSLSASTTDDRMRITVRSAGDHSSRLAHIPVGTWAIVEGPYGTFTAGRGRRNAPALLIAGGAGVAPLRAIAEDLHGRDVVVVLRDSHEALLAGELQQLATVHEVLGSRAELGHDPMDPQRLQALVPDLAERDIWICGPLGMTATAVGSCLTLGTPAAHIHLEDYEL